MKLDNAIFMNWRSHLLVLALDWIMFKLDEKAFAIGDFHRKGNNKIDVTLKFQKQFTTFFPVLGFHLCQYEWEKTVFDPYFFLVYIFGFNMAL